MDPDALKEVARKIAAGKKNVAFTGAGISVESGIPDFRSAGGLWERFDPMEYATIDAFRADPTKVWGMLAEMHEVVERARPNPAHRALARLEELGLLAGVITQNIDNLHQEAGSNNVIEFHGNARRLVCACGFAESAKATMRRMAEQGRPMPPRCERCFAVLKPDVVFFGEPIPPRAHRLALQLSEAPDVFLVVGTSAEVAPASYLPVVARRTGGTVVEVNLEPTPLSDGIADFAFRGQAGEVLPALVQEVERLV